MKLALCLLLLFGCWWLEPQLTELRDAWQEDWRKRRYAAELAEKERKHREGLEILKEYRDRKANH